jgi:hypothetical protein
MALWSLAFPKTDFKAVDDGLPEHGLPCELVYQACQWLECFDVIWLDLNANPIILAPKAKVRVHPGGPLGARAVERCPASSDSNGRVGDTLTSARGFRYSE